MLNAYFESKKVVTERNIQILELFLEVEREKFVNSLLGDHNGPF